MLRNQARILSLCVLVLVMAVILSRTIGRGIHEGKIGIRGGLGHRKFGFSSWSQKSWQGERAGGASAAKGADNCANGIAQFQAAVAYEPKNRDENNFVGKKKIQTANSPTGEDNLFVSEKDVKGYKAIGVADGVGGWAEAGYDSSAISRELCTAMKKGFEDTSEPESLHPKQLLIDSFEKVLSSEKVFVGGTTACAGVFSPDYKLKIANLGDSWCGLFRDYKLVNETKFQTHNFNTPYQLAKIPDFIIEKAAARNRRYILDTPQMADLYCWDLQKGDLIMFATDGVTDNVVPQDISLFLKDQLEDKPQKSLEQVASTFVKEVVGVSKDMRFPSTFAQELSRLTGQKYLGGKEDDITVVLVRVT